MMNWREVLSDLKPDADALVEERTAFARRHQEALLASLPRDELREVSLLRLRALAFESMTRWRRDTEELDEFLQLAIVDAHDATVDAIVAIQSGVGSPAIALLRRQYELMLLLIAGWRNPPRLEELMKEALERPFPDDRYTLAAHLGMLGAVMPKTWQLRDIGLTAEREVDEIRFVESVESGLASFGHGGALAVASYLVTRRNHLKNALKMARVFDPLVTYTTALISASASRIGARLDYAQIYGPANTVFGIDEINRRETEAVRAFDDAFPLALDVLWATYLGLNSVNTELAQRLGKHGNDPERRQLIVLMDGLETSWLATEYLFRGRLSGAATLTRRVFELSLEAQAWLRKENTMRKRFVEELSHGENRDRTMPNAATMIRWLHGSRSSGLQRQTYSTLCSTAHGGIQGQEYLLETEGGSLVIKPAPHFAYRHHSWLLGTLVSAVDALLNAALLIAARHDESILKNHWGYHEFFRAAQKDMQGLTLVGHLDLDGIDRPSFE